MSRFFRPAGDSDSESEESEDELMSSGDEDAPPVKPSTTTAARPAMSSFLKKAGSESSDSDSSEESDTDSEEEESRPNVRIMSAQEKRLSEMEATGKVMDNALKINDWVTISNGALDSLISQLILIVLHRV